MSERRKTIVTSSPDVSVPGMRPVARGLDGSTLRRIVRSKPQAQPDLGLLDIPFVSADASVDSHQDALDLFPRSTVVYSRPRTPKLSQEGGRLFKGLLPSGQLLIPVADSDGSIQLQTDKGNLVHYVGIEGMNDSSESATGINN
jgi:hypothetical protein